MTDKIVQENVPRNQLKSFRFNYYFEIVDEETRESLRDGGGGTILVEAEDKATASDLAQDNLGSLIPAEEGEERVPYTDMDEPTSSRVEFAIVLQDELASFDRKNVTLVEKGFDTEEQANRFIEKNIHLEEEQDFKELAVREYYPDEELKVWHEEKRKECQFCKETFSTAKGRKIHEGKIHKR